MIHAEMSCLTPWPIWLWAVWRPAVRLHYWYLQDNIQAPVLVVYQQTIPPVDIFIETAAEH